MTLAERRRAFVFAGLATVASVVGGALGYFIGWGLYEAVGQPILSFYGYGDRFAAFADRYNAFGAWIVLFAGITPFPYKVITIASGVTGLSFPVFMVASIIARGLRFYLVCGLLYWLGPEIRSFIERRLGLLVTLFFIALFGGFLLVRYVF
jgi:membrane protein YqaA with SNARE-associated domain